MDNIENDQKAENDDLDMDNEDMNNSESSSDESSQDTDTENTEMDTDIQKEQNYESKLAELEQIINQNKFQYQTYIDIINLTKEHGEFNKLREYREKMSQVFPLTESKKFSWINRKLNLINFFFSKLGLWLEWLKDEQKFLDNEEDRKKVDELFKRAVQDYLSVELWLEYIQYSIGGMGEENGIENVKNICENAISFAGFHVTRGYTLWEVYREFETALLAGYQQSSAGSIQTPEQTKQINEQIEKITHIFKRQLGVCLDNIESTYEELKQFDESASNDTQVKLIYEANLKKFKELEPFENALNEAVGDATKKIEAYFSYLDFEIKQIKEMEKRLLNNQKNIKTVNSINGKNSEMEILEKSRVRVKCLFERAIADDSNCLNVNLWLKYIYYLIEEESKQFSDGKDEYNLNVFKRSIRNCPWSAKLWTTYALEIEKFNSPTEQIKNVYKEAMQAGLQTSDDYLELWHAYLGYLKRSLLSNFDNETQEKKDLISEEIRDNFQKAINQLFDYFKLNGDPRFSLERFWAQIEAKYFKSMDKSRKIYNEMILAKSDIGEISHEVWIDFYQLEIQYGDEKHQRKLLNRALNELKYDTDKQVILELLVNFEKLNGNIGHFKTAYHKYEILKDKIQSNYLKSQQKLSEKQTQEKEQHAKSKQKPKKEDHNKKENQTKGIKRKKSETDSDSNSKQIKDKDGFAIPSLPDFKQPESKPSVSTPNEYKKVDPNCTVFISNIKFDVEEAKIRELFEKQPGFLCLRLIKHWSGKTKGYGYVDFEKPEQAENALKLDRSPIEGRPLFVSKNEEKDSELNFAQNKFKFATSMEKSKLFVSGLPFSTTKEELEEIFKTFGKVKEVRIVTYKSGKSKGLAYVELEDEQSASKALIQTDGMLIGENQISVAISNPPKRKQPFESRESEQEIKKDEIKKSLGSGSVESRSSSTSTPMSFVPRSQQLLGRKKTLNLK
ncbi:unnamed protein product [Brachionus calyciflorus]|uniref:RRM domain-containing protein n=1 Tax=Brachionus calyciflorus TaxID=104777 RepID=A0A813MBZ7_9BILA|nr:unnamed protein product [Brachionus calyciflorus]